MQGIKIPWVLFFSNEVMYTTDVWFHIGTVHPKYTILVTLNDKVSTSPLITHKDEPFWDHES